MVLAAFVAIGARTVAHWRPALDGRRLVGATLAVGLIWQALVTDAALHDRGVVTRQIGGLSPIRRSQFATRALLDWTATHATPTRPVLVTPHTIESPYLALRRAPLQDAGKLVVQSYYLPKSQLVHTRVSLEQALADGAERAGWIATSAGLRQLGLRDALERELVRPDSTPSGFVWHGVRLAPVAAWGDVRLWRVVR